MLAVCLCLIRILQTVPVHIEQGVNSLPCCHAGRGPGAALSAGDGGAPQRAGDGLHLARAARKVSSSASDTSLLNVMRATVHSVHVVWWLSCGRLAWERHDIVAFWSWRVYTAHTQLCLAQLAWRSVVQ